MRTRVGNVELICGDCLEWMQRQPDDSVDLIFGSPPYEAARSYGIGFDLKGQEWVDWMLPRVVEAVRICKGLVAFVVEGQTRGFQWSATPALLMADLHRAGIHLRKPAVFHRRGLPGSGGTDWLRNNWEFIICCTSGGKMPWSDNTAMGHLPINGRRVRMTNRVGDGTRQSGWYKPPQKVNPGNVISLVVGGSRMGSQLAHENEAPFPERLAEFFIRSFCPPDGIVVDPFSGSGTTAAVAARLGRRGIGIDVRESQTAIARRRVKELSLPRKMMSSTKNRDRVGRNDKAINAIGKSEMRRSQNSAKSGEGS